MKKILSIMLLSAILLCSCTEPSVDTSSQDISSNSSVPEDGIWQGPAFIGKIEESINADIDGDGRQDRVVVFKENGNGIKVAAVFSDESLTSVGVASDEDNMEYSYSSLHIEKEDIVFTLVKQPNNEIYEYRVQFKKVENGYETTIHAKRMEDGQPPENNEETPSYIYARKGEESLFVEDAKEIIESFKTKDENFEDEAKRNGANIHSVSNSLIQMYEYTLEEYAETGKIEPRATNRYYYRDDYVITEHEDSVSISKQELIPFKDITDKLREMKIDAETMSATLVEIADLGRCYYVDDGQTRILVAAQDIEDSYMFDNAAMLLFYDTSDGIPYNCIILNDATQLRAKGVAADEEEYAQMIREMIEKDGPAAAFTGGKGWYDREILSKYFVKSCNLPENKDYSKLIKPKNMQYFGQSNGWRIYHATYEGQACDTAIIEKDLGGYKFYSSGIYYPSEVSIYAIKRKEVLTLEQAYEKGEIDVKEVYEFTPEVYKR